jgi:hypothetical protein
LPEADANLLEVAKKIMIFDQIIITRIYFISVVFNLFIAALIIDLIYGLKNGNNLSKKTQVIFNQFINYILKKKNINYFTI